MEDKSNAGSNQLVALLLAIFLGGLGIHRFYLGYIGIGIVQLLLALLGFLIVPLIVLFIWVLIDIIRIATGALGPKNGEYTDTL
ncbi:MAG: TM2 domain-containing protein [Cyclobacteriaceae bacterium]|nr:TM2 domain-containing protein [Cyclobacteriaceae bacterium]